ncbi:MAG: hypothetical protein JSR60_07885 [Proteobacteria bacterium]|nr:hypothetical protein [Pseudomonadota bacterium]
MPDSMYRRYPVFLSSLCWELSELRAKAYADVGHGRQIYVDECATPRNIAQQDDLTAADELIRRVREADLLVCVLGGRRHGTPIKVDGHQSAVSFFEIELYQAALWGKGVRIYVREDFEPEPRMESLLKVLDFAFGDWRSSRRLNDAEILSRLQRDIWLGRASRAVDAVNYHSVLTRLVQGMYIHRARNRSPPSVHFLNGEQEAPRRDPDLSIVASIAEDIRARPNEEQRLSRIWIAMRELMGAHYSTTSDPDVLRLWNDLLGNWTSAGSWYGLHGDTPLGCLAALNSQLIVRQKLVPVAKSTEEASRYGYAGGALASAKYSIAERLYVAADRQARLEEALQDLQRAFDEKTASRSGLLAIRGSIQRSAGRISEAIADHEEVLQLRSDGQHSAAQIGEAESELGYGYLFQWRFRKGLEFCEEGVRKLRGEQGRKGFLVRGLRKLAVAYALNGRLLKAYETRQEARNVSRLAGTFDQMK